MIHEGEQLKKQIKQLERELEAPIDYKRRSEIQTAINHLKDKKRSWEKPR